MNPEIFREYDIRGVAGKDITGDEVILIGKAAGTYLRQHGRNRLTVGRDCRITSESYTEKVIEGLVSTGCEVTDIGVCTSPILYFSIQHLNQEGGIMVTASHNPKEYNGFKLCMGTDSIHGEEIQKIRELIDKGEFAIGQGKVSESNVIPDYNAYIQKNIEISKPLKIGIDAGNGTAGVIAVPLLKSLGCRVFDIYCEMDGTFPNHEADPTVAENMKDLSDLVKSEGLDIGIGYDGDGDRIGILDENGEIVFGDKLLIIFAREILSRKPGATFISEVKCSKVMYDDIEKHGGRAIMWKTGHSLIKQKMKQENAALAGEMSGHIFFSDRYLGFDDAVYASCRLIEILADTGKKISELLSDIPKTYSTPEIRVECPDNKKFALVDKVTEYFQKDYNVIDIDGVRVLFDDGWGLVRASNTQPALVLRFEALTKERLEEIKNLVETVLEEMKHSNG